MHCLVSWQLIPRDNELVRLPQNFFSQNLHHAFCIAFGHWYNWKDDSSSKAAERKSRLLLLFIYSYSRKCIYLLLLELKGPLRFWYKPYLIHIQCWRSPRSFCSEWFCARGRKRRLGLTEDRVLPLQSQGPAPWMSIFRRLLTIVLSMPACRGKLYFWAMIVGYLATLSAAVLAWHTEHDQWAQIWMLWDLHHWINFILIPNQMLDPF